jgi:hypothetical protein
MICVVSKDGKATDLPVLYNYKRVPSTAGDKTKANDGIARKIGKNFFLYLEI